MNLKNNYAEGGYITPAEFSAICGSIVQLSNEFSQCGLLQTPEINIKTVYNWGDFFKKSDYSAVIDAALEMAQSCNGVTQAQEFILLSQEELCAEVINALCGFLNTCFEIKPGADNIVRRCGDTICGE